MDIHLIQRDVGKGLKVNDGLIDPTKKNNVEVKMNDEQLTANENEILSSVASNKLFENGVGADVLGYIEDGALHEVNTVWLSRNTPGEFKCLIANSDNYPDLTPTAPKWLQIDDLTNASKIENLSTFTTANVPNSVPSTQPGYKQLVLQKIGALKSISGMFNATSSQVIYTGIIPLEFRPKVSTMFFGCLSATPPLTNGNAVSSSGYLEPNGDLMLVGDSDYVGRQFIVTLKFYE